MTILRKVMVTKEEYNIESKKCETIDLYEAWFHAFSQNSDSEGPIPVAIIEHLSTGKVGLVLPENLRFLDSPV